MVKKDRARLRSALMLLTVDTKIDTKQGELVRQRQTLRNKSLSAGCCLISPGERKREVKKAGLVVQLSPISTSTKEIMLYLPVNVDPISIVVKRYKRSVLLFQNALQEDLHFQ
jgi:hypothetical protein